MATSLVSRATVNGTELAYEIHGTGEPVVLIHGGIVADAMVPLRSERELADRHRLVTYHRRGYGESARAGGTVSIGEHTADCLVLLRHLGIPRAHVAGYSFGGAIGLQMALDAPDAVGSLALLEPTVPQAIDNPDTLAFLLTTIGAAVAQYERGETAEAIDTWASGAFGSGYRDALEQALPGAHARAVADADALFEMDARALQQWQFGPEEAGRIQQPVLSVYHDDPVWAGFRETHGALRAWLPRTEACAVPDATHLLHMTRPRPVAAALAGFFARHPLGSRAE